ncbi:MAG: hypothetical protein WCG25_07825 [bacterium]
MIASKFILTGALHFTLLAFIYIHILLLLSQVLFPNNVRSVPVVRIPIFIRPLSSTIHIGFHTPSPSISLSHTSHIQSLSVSVCVGLYAFGQLSPALSDRSQS